MSKPLNIAPIPTIYRGRQYRSRLEAKWAAFFDNLGWSHEYEPYDLGCWSPDFLLSGAYGADILVEVKPIREFSAEVGDKIERAHRERSLDNVGYLLVGVAPFIAGQYVQLGWMGQAEEDGSFSWTPCFSWWFADYKAPILRADAAVLQKDGPEGICISGLLNDNHWHSTYPNQSYAEHTMQLWAQASNRAQWKPPA